MLRAVDDVTFHVGPGETLGLVGESGCGKTTVGRLILRLLPVTAGRIVFDGQDVTDVPERRLRDFRRAVQVVFQDPYSSLNPRLTVRDIVGEPLRNFGATRRAAAARVGELLDTVGLPADYMTRYPHAFSGGQRQRIGIARALALGPRLLVCDEAVSSLDVSVQAQILNLLADLQRQLGLALLFISHNLAVVRHVSHRVAVMYLGRLVEVAPEAALFEHPRHPYTRALLAAVPEAGPDAAAARRAARRDAEPARSAGGLPVPDALPSGRGALPRRRAAARRGAARPLGPLLLPGAGALAANGLRSAMLVERTHYYAKPGRAAEVLATRRRASEVRVALGLPHGRILAKADPAGDGPDVTWECAFPDATAQARGPRRSRPEPGVRGGARPDDGADRPVRAPRPGRGRRRPRAPSRTRRDRSCPSRSQVPSGGRALAGIPLRPAGRRPVPRPGPEPREHDSSGHERLLPAGHGGRAHGMGLRRAPPAPPRLRQLRGPHLAPGSDGRVRDRRVRSGAGGAARARGGRRGRRRRLARRRVPRWPPTGSG